MTGMKKVTVDLGSASYEVRIGTELLERVGLWMKEFQSLAISDKAVIVTDTVVRDLHADKLRMGLERAGFTVSVFAVPPGEDQKTLNSASRLYAELANAYADRRTPIFALGGGVVGDLAGFVAATYLRGVPLVQVPTTLLAQVDSSVGGKTAVDMGLLKNIIGSFYQPKLVIADIDTLRTLPETEVINGLGEVIKHAAIRDRAFFDFLETNMGLVKSINEAVVTDMVAQNVKIKADVVSKDERETGLREILNYGHTIGHAVESVSQFALKHGEAVAIGMTAAAKIASRMGVLDPAETSRLEDLITRAGLPSRLPDVSKDAVLNALKHDKKVREGKVRFVLLRSLGHAFVSDDVPPELIEEVLRGWG